jgi:hypothetical protein
LVCFLTGVMGYRVNGWIGGQVAKGWRFGFFEFLRLCGEKYYSLQK